MIFKMITRYVFHILVIGFFLALERGLCAHLDVPPSPLQPDQAKNSLQKNRGGMATPRILDTTFNSSIDGDSFTTKPNIPEVRLHIQKNRNNTGVTKEITQKSSGQLVSINSLQKNRGMVTPRILDSTFNSSIDSNFFATKPNILEVRLRINNNRNNSEVLSGVWKEKIHQSSGLQVSKNSLQKNRVGMETPGTLDPPFNTSTYSDSFTTKPTFHIKNRNDSGVTKEIIRKSSSVLVSKNSCRPDKLQNTIGSCRDGQMKFKIQDRYHVIFVSVISQFVELLQFHYFSWVEDDGSLCEFWKMIGQNTSLIPRDGILRRVFINLQRLDEQVVDAVLGLDTEQLKKVDLKVLPRSIAYHLPMKTLMEIPGNKIGNLIIHHGGLDFVERFLAVILSNSSSVDTVTYLLRKMNTNFKMCEFMSSSLYPLLEELFARIPNEVIVQLPKCILIHLPARVLSTFSPELVHKIFFRVGTMLANQNFAKFFLRRKWFKVIEARSSIPMVLSFRNRSLVLGMSFEELKQQWLTKVTVESLQVINPLMLMQPQLPQGQLLLSFLLSSPENESRYQALQRLSNINGIGSYFTVGLIQDLSYRKFTTVFHHLIKDSSVPEKLSLAVAWSTLSRFFRFLPRPWTLTLPELMRLQHLSFALSFPEITGADLEEHLELFHLPHLQLAGLPMASRRHLANLCLKLVQDGCCLQEDDFHLIPLPLLPAYPFSTLQHFSVSMITNNLQLFTRVAKEMPLHHKIWLLNEVKDDLWLYVDDLLTFDGVEYLIPYLPMQTLRTVISSYLTSRKYDDSIMQQARLLPSNILRIWQTYNRNLFFLEGVSYYDLTWMRSGVLGLSCADVDIVNSEDFLGMMHLYHHHIHLTESQTLSAWIIPVSLCHCLKKGFVQYKQSVASISSMPSHMVLTNLTPAEANLLGGQVLAEFRSDELSLVPHPTCRLVFQLIGSARNQELLTDPSRCTLMAQNALNCTNMTDPSLSLKNLQVLGNLVFCLDPLVFGTIKSSILSEFLRITDIPYQACPNEKHRANIVLKLKEVFGSPDKWNKEDTFTLSGLLFLFKPSELFRITMKALDGLGEYLIRLYANNSLEDKAISSFPLVCYKKLLNHQIKESMDAILRLAQQAIIYSLHLNQEIRLSCDAVRSVGAAAVTFTAKELSSMTEFEFSHCFEFFGRISWPSHVSSYIWKRIKQKTVSSGRELTEEDIMQLEKLSVMLEPSELRKLSFAFPRYMDLVAMFGRQTNWNVTQKKYLGGKWMEDNQCMIYLEPHEIAALNNILCGLPLHYLHMTPSVLRQSLPILSKLESCPEDHLKLIALQVIAYDILGSPLMWDQEDLEATGVIASYVPSNGSFNSNLLVSSLKKTEQDRVRDMSCTIRSLGRREKAELIGILIVLFVSCIV